MAVVTDLGREIAREKSMPNIFFMRAVKEGSNLHMRTTKENTPSVVASE